MENSRPRSLGLLLINGFALMSYASVLEPYRAANTLAGRELYRWRNVAVDGRASAASNGATIFADQGLDEPLECDTLFVFAGGDPTRFDNKAVFAWLRQIARSGSTLAGISAGPYLLARAGLLDGYSATIHWEHRPAFEEAFPLVTSDHGLYVIDRKRVTCAGGMAGMDLAIQLIEREQGHKIAAEVSDWFIRTDPRPADRPQRLSLRERYEVADDRILKVLAHMEASVEDPVSRGSLASIAGVSIRQLERLFVGALNASVNETYLRIRLDQAAQLLRATAMSITSVGLACGFRSASHFSRSYKTYTGRAPSQDRRRSS